MKDDKKNPQEETQTKLRKVSRKRWIYPAVYLCVAALIMSGVLWMEKGNGGQNAQNTPNASSNNTAFPKVAKKNPDAVSVNTTNKELLKWPVANKSQITIGQKFYDPNSSEADQVAALVNYDNTYAPNTGINLVANDKKSFDVTAALSGTVIEAKKDSLLGYVVEIEHNNGVNTLYESLAAIDVKKGDHVDQDQLLGQAGTDSYNKEAGTHLHFEVRKNGVPVNPTMFWNKQTTAVSLPTKDQSTSAQATDNGSTNTNSGNDMNSTSQSSNNQTSNNAGQNSDASTSDNSSSN